VCSKTLWTQHQFCMCLHAWFCGDFLKLRIIAVVTRSNYVDWIGGLYRRKYSNIVTFYSQTFECALRRCEHNISFVCVCMRDFLTISWNYALLPCSSFQLRWLNRRPTGVSTATLLPFYSQSLVDCNTLWMQHCFCVWMHARFLCDFLNLHAIAVFTRSDYSDWLWGLPASVQQHYYMFIAKLSSGL